MQKKKTKIPVDVDIVDDILNQLYEHGVYPLLMEDMAAQHYGVHYTRQELEQITKLIEAFAADLQRAGFVLGQLNRRYKPDTEQVKSTLRGAAATAAERELLHKYKPLFYPEGYPLKPPPQSKA